METKIIDQKEPLIKIDIDGYALETTPTKMSFGGYGLFIRTDLDYKNIKNLSKSVESVAESIFIEIVLKNNKNSLLVQFIGITKSISYFVDNLYFAYC